VGRSLKLRVVAEGVETLEELMVLQGLECDEAQGFYFSPPVAAAKFADLFQKGTAGVFVH
jgi:EAL domain-containing protein (putative c-di-GMP-specific phosphodiesterase class I)